MKPENDKSIFTNDISLILDRGPMIGYIWSHAPPCSPYILCLGAHAPKQKTNKYPFRLLIKGHKVCNLSLVSWERSGSVVECLTRDQGTAGSSLMGITAL